MEAGKLHQQLEEGADFETLARERSEDSLTADKGGELPELTLDELESEEVRNAISQLAEGEYTSPLRTQYGMQIFQLLSVAAAEQKPFAEVRDELIGDIKREKAIARYAELITDLDLLVYENESGFFEAIADYGYRKQSTEFLDISQEEDLLAYPAIRAAVIAELLPGDKVNSGLIEIDEGQHFFFVGIGGEKKPAQLSYANAEQDIKAAMILEQAYQKAKDDSERWLTALRAGSTDLDAIATDNQLSVAAPGYIKRSESSVPRPIVDKVFEISAADKPVYQTLQLEGSHGDDLVIVELVAVRDGEIDEDDPTPNVIYSLENREMLALLESLREFYRVEIDLPTEAAL